MVMVERKAENIDADILECQQDILKARKKADSSKDARRGQNEQSDGISEQPDASAAENDTVSKDKGSKFSADNAPEVKSDTKFEEYAKKTTRQLEGGLGEAILRRKEHLGDGTEKITQFDLAEEIMAKQRQRTAIKRQGPETAPGKSRYAVERLRPKPDKAAQSVISELVARDIDRLCRGQDLDD